MGAIIFLLIPLSSIGLLFFKDAKKDRKLIMNTLLILNALFSFTNDNGVFQHTFGRKYVGRKYWRRRVFMALSVHSSNKFHCTNNIGRIKNYVCQQFKMNFDLFT